MAGVQFQLSQNDVKSISNPARITAIGGDNGTEFFINFPDFPPGSQWVQPFTYGFMYVVDTPTYASVKVDASQVAPGFTTPIVTTKVAKLAAYNTNQVFNPGLTQGAAAPWQTPTIAIAFDGPADGAVLRAGVAGQRIYLHTINAMVDVPVAGGWFRLHSPLGTSIAEFSTAVVAPHFQDFKGFACPVGASVVLSLFTAMNVRGTLLVSQA